MNDIHWLAGWYATRLHAVVGPPPQKSDGSVQSACGAWVDAVPRTEWAARAVAKGIKRCAHCERILAKRPANPRGLSFDAAVADLRAWLARTDVALPQDEGGGLLAATVTIDFVNRKVEIVRPPAPVAQAHPEYANRPVDSDLTGTS